MKRLILLSLLLAATVAAQNPATPLPTTATNPNGQACQANTVLNYVPSGVIYTCQNGTMAVATGGSGISACSTTPPTTGTAGQVCVAGTSQYLCHTTGACSVSGDWTLVGPSGLDILRFSICLTAGCGSETTINSQTTNTSGNFTECVANLSVAPTGSSTIWQVQRSQSPWTSWTAINTLTLSVANGLAPVHQATFANSPQPFAVDDKYRVQVTQNDSNGVAQGGTVQCR
jgi:hypothetical protein